MGNLTGNNNIVKVSKIPKTYDVRRASAAVSSTIVNDQPFASSFRGMIPKEPGPDSNFILVSSVGPDGELSIITTTDGGLLIWR